jgi:hypothetical protein
MSIAHGDEQRSTSATGVSFRLGRTANRSAERNTERPMDSLGTEYPLPDRDHAVSLLDDHSLLP